MTRFRAAMNSHKAAMKHMWRAIPSQKCDPYKAYQAENKMILEKRLVRYGGKKHIANLPTGKLEV